jgi:hypothetical protein
MAPGATLQRLPGMEPAPISSGGYTHMNGRVQSRRVKGQSAVMVSLLIMIVVMLIAFTTNLGKLVTEKIAMQNAVDMAVYSGAATQAGYLNKMRDVNNDIWKIHKDVRVQLDPSRNPAQPLFFKPMGCTIPCCGGTPMAPTIDPVPIKGVAIEPILDLQEQRIKTMLLPKFRLLNQRAPQDSFTAAKDAADANYSGTGNKLREKARSPGVLIPVETKDIEWDYMGWGSGVCPGVPAPCFCRSALVTTRKVPSWYFRTSQSGEVMFAAGIEGATPKSPFLDGGYLGQFFSGSCSYGGGASGGRCALNVYAAAHPHQGKLGSIPNRGRTTQEMTWFPSTENQIPAAPMGVDARTSMDRHQVTGRDYHDYKVRFIGIFETDAQTLTGMSLSSAVSPQYGNKMEH